MKGKKDCFHCIHGHHVEGDYGDYWTPSEPSYIECENDKVDWDELEKSKKEHDFNEDKLPYVCGHYKPKIIKKCNGCNKEINIPSDEIEYYLEDTPICSKECFEKSYSEWSKQFDVEFL